MSRKRAIRAHYERTAATERENHAIVDWADAASQLRRFEVLADNVPLAGKSLLDVGCGLGDLWAFLKARGLPVQYTGVDLVRKMVALARKRHPDARFVCADIFAADPFGPASFDVAYGSGVFNLELGNNTEFLAHAIGRLIEIARGAVVFNLLHRRAQPKYEHCTYYDPEQVLAMLRTFTGQVQLIDDYLPNDFTVICRK